MIGRVFADGEDAGGAALMDGAKGSSSYSEMTLMIAGIGEPDLYTEAVSYTHLTLPTKA